MISFSQIRILLLICCEILIVAKYNTPSLQLRPQFQIEGSGRHFMGQSQLLCGRMMMITNSDLWLSLTPTFSGIMGLFIPLNVVAPSIYRFVPCECNATIYHIIWNSPINIVEQIGCLQIECLWSSIQIGVSLRIILDLNVINVAPAASDGDSLIYVLLILFEIWGLPYLYFLCLKCKQTCT